MCESVTVFQGFLDVLAKSYLQLVSTDSWPGTLEFRGGGSHVNTWLTTFLLKDGAVLQDKVDQHIRWKVKHIWQTEKPFK